MSEWFLDEDTPYPMAGYEGNAEFSLTERDHYTVGNDDELPTVSISTNLGPHELPPKPSNHTLNYQQYHQELEGWTIFRSLPMMMQYDQVMVNFVKNLGNGTLKIPEWIMKSNPPSLFAYYNTLP